MPVTLAIKQYDLVLCASKHGVKHSGIPGENDGSQLVNAEFGASLESRCQRETLLTE